MSNFGPVPYLYPVPLYTKGYRGYRFYRGDAPVPGYRLGTGWVQGYRLAVIRPLGPSCACSLSDWPPRPGLNSKVCRPVYH